MQKFVEKAIAIKAIGAGVESSISILFPVLAISSIFPNSHIEPRGIILISCHFISSLS